MPTIIRWFKVTHDINSDPEIWELREKFGDRAGFVWLEILSIADRNKGLLGYDSPQLHAVLASKCRVYSPKVRAIFGWCLGKGWLVDRDGLRVAKWSKYNKTRGDDEFPSYTRQTKHTKQDIPKDNKAPEAPLALPGWIDQQTWSDYKQMRIKLRKPMTRRAEVLALQHLDALREQGEDPQKVVEQSICYSWQALYPVKNNNSSGQAEGELSEQTKRILRRGL